MKRGLYLIIFIFLLAPAFAVDQEIVSKINHLELLAVKEIDGEFVGSIADLYLEMKEGSGRVFLETYPLTKMDTQISTRFAKEMACDYFDLRCEDYDFIYTIKAKSDIVGGPSAGAAITALTTVSLLKLELDGKTTITGTINSGGIIGPVGGVKEKLEAAAQNGITQVLIAKGSAVYTDDDNETVDLIKYGRENLSMEVVEVGDLNEVLFYLTGKKIKEDSYNVEINKDYQETMKKVSELLCERTTSLEKELPKLNESELELIKTKKEQAANSSNQGDDYSAASFCFGANIIINELIIRQQNLTEEELEPRLKKLRQQVILLEEKLEKQEIETISDLQTMMIVKSRLHEVETRTENFNESENREYILAYGEERLFSAVAWMYFFGMEGKEFVLNQARLRDSCLQKIAESRERYQYVEIIFKGFDTDHINEKIEGAAAKYEESDYELCLIEAAQAKAEADTILSAMGLSEESLDSFLESKSKAVEKIISENSQEGVFPILGYSYYQYANSLKATEQSSALLYFEYALEMSDLDIYFKEKKVDLVSRPIWGIEQKEWLYFISGFFLGALTIWLLAVILSRKLVKYRFFRRR
ncbi:MAG: S16 family serine protease [Candidatus Woesearchaeota archaeon]